jgi:hypothetical protein
MPRFSAYKEATREVKVELTTGDTLTLHYAPSRYAGDLPKRSSEVGFLARSLGITGETTATADPEKIAQLEAKMIPNAEYVARLVVRWDFTDDKDKPIPVTREWIEENVGDTDQQRMAEALREDQFPSPGQPSNKDSTTTA